jgi:very-short-patch-repair endonuclease
MHDLAALLGPSRTAPELVLARVATPRSVRRWLASGRLVRLHPGWVTTPEWVGDWTVRAYAATGYTGGVLSHGSALTAHGLVDRPTARIDVTVPPTDRLRSTRRLCIHRSSRRSGITIARGLATTSVARALVDAWGDAHRGRRSVHHVDLARNAVYRAARERRVTLPAVESELLVNPRLPGMGALRELLGEVGSGAHSHLESIGMRALMASGLPRPRRQYAINLPNGNLRVDLAWPEVKLAVEFDGAAYHADRGDWQRDLRRDAALAALGWLVLRFSYAAISERPATCAAQVADAYRARHHHARGHDVPGADIPDARMSAPGTSWLP